MMIDPDGYEEVTYEEDDGNITNDKVGKPASGSNTLADGAKNPHPGRGGGPAHKSWVKQVVEVLKAMYPGANVKTEARGGR